MCRYVMQAHLFCVEISSRTKCLAVVETLSSVVVSVYLTRCVSERDCTANEIVVFTKPYKKELLRTLVQSDAVRCRRTYPT